MREYYDIVGPLISNDKYLLLKDEIHHHNSNRFNHSFDVSLYTYKICKFFNLDYKSATRGAILHDFFFRGEFFNIKDCFVNHPRYSLKNSMMITCLNEKEKNIILSHMFPISGCFPKSFEALIVNFVDDYVSLKEKFGGDYKCLKAAINFLFILIINVIIR